MRKKIIALITPTVITILFSISIFSNLKLRKNCINNETLIEKIKLDNKKNNEKHNNIQNRLILEKSELIKKNEQALEIINNQKKIIENQKNKLNKIGIPMDF